MGKQTAIHITNSMFRRLCEHLFETRSTERMATAFFHTSQSLSVLKLLVRKVRVPREQDYLRRDAGFVSLEPDYMEQCLQHCEEHRCSLLDIHTHPWSELVSFSAIDDREAREVKIPYMEKYLPETSIAFMVLGRNPEVVQARIWDRKVRELLLIPRIVVL